MNYEQLKKYVKRERLPSKVVVVSEDYPAECISYRTLLNPLQMQYKVKGYDMSSIRPSSSSSDKSLKLKPAGIAVKARRPETQTTNNRAPTPPSAVPLDDRSDDAVVSETSVHRRNSPVSNVESTAELDAAIRQAQELQHVPLDNEDEPISRPTSLRWT